MSKKQNFRADLALLSSDPLVGPDAELIRLCDVIVAGHRELDVLTERYIDLIGDPPKAVQRRERALVDEGHELSEQVAVMRATTPAGFRAKAAALLTYVGRKIDGGPIWTNHDELLGWSLARDLLGVDDGAPVRG